MNCRSKGLAFILSLILAALSNLGCSTLKNPYYYEVEKSGRKAYVLGTAHFGWGINELPNFILKDLKNSSSLAVEMDTADVRLTRNTAFIEYIQKEALRLTENRIKSKTKTSTLMPERTWSYVLRKLPEYNEEKLEYLPYIMISSLIRAKYPEKVYLDEDRAYGINFERLDEQIIKFGRKDRKTIFELDEKFLNIECIDQMAIDQLNKGASGSAKPLATELNAFYDTYNYGDEDILYNLIRDGFDESFNCVFLDRNQKWAKRVDAIHEEHWPLFIAGGAGHMVGLGSFLEELRKLGYTVQRITKR